MQLNLGATNTQRKKCWYKENSIAECALFTLHKYLLLLFIDWNLHHDTIYYSFERVADEMFVFFIEWECRVCTFLVGVGQ